MSMSKKYPNVKVSDAALNPFLCEMKLSTLQQMKVAVLAVLLAPIRFLLIILLMFVMGAVGTVFTQRSSTGEHKPFNWFSRFGQLLMRRLARMVLFIMGFHNVKLKGKFATGDVAPIHIIAPHSSFVDSFALGMLDYISIIAKKEIEQTFIINAIGCSMKPIVVKRTEKGSLDRITAAIHKRVKEGNWPPVVIFPEGTCTNRRALISFKIGAFRPGLPVQPITISFPNDVDFISWTWKGPPTWKSMLFMLSQFHNRMEIEALPVYFPSDEEKKDARLYARNVRSYMARSLGVPVTDHTFEDGLMMYEASRLGLPKETGMIEFDAVKVRLGLNIDLAKELLGQFSRIDGDKDGIIDSDDLAKYYGIDDGDQTIKFLFKEFDQDNAGAINFKSYLMGRRKLQSMIEEDDLTDEAYTAMKHGSENELDIEMFQNFFSKSMLTISGTSIVELFRRISGENKALLLFDNFKKYVSLHPEFVLMIKHTAADCS